MIDRMRFGIFLTPFHLPVTQSVNWALRKDVEMVKHYDRLGFDEVWFGEHHSGGSEIIGDPMTMIAYCAPQTDRIKLGTGVLSLPYHNPLWAAETMLTLDHLTRGRAMFGLGPGVLVSDAAMIGIDPLEQRDAFAEDVDVLMHLLRSTEPLSVKTSRYELTDALVQLPPYTDFEILIAAVVSPSGPRIAAKHGLSLLSLAASTKAGAASLESHRQVIEELSPEFGQAPRPREEWRLLAPMYVAETRDKAIEQVQFGIDHWFDYMQNVAATPQFGPEGSTTKERIEWIIESNIGVIGTPEDAVDHIGRMVDATGGGFGTFLMHGTEWARFEDTKRSTELFAEYVMPAFQYPKLDRRLQSETTVRQNAPAMLDRQSQAVAEAHEKHQKDRAAKRAVSID
jgi:limonene 1,2-monooxygenase